MDETCFLTKQIPPSFSQKENTTMGGTFRSSEYISFERFGGASRTIKDGEAAVTPGGTETVCTRKSSDQSKSSGSILPFDS